MVNLTYSLSRWGTKGDSTSKISHIRVHQRPHENFVVFKIYSYLAGIFRRKLANSLKQRFWLWEWIFWQYLVNYGQTWFLDGILWCPVLHQSTYFGNYYFSLRSKKSYPLSISPHPIFIFLSLSIYNKCYIVTWWQWIKVLESTFQVKAMLM